MGKLGENYKRGSRKNKLSKARKQNDVSAPVVVLALLPIDWHEL